MVIHNRGRRYNYGASWHTTVGGSSPARLTYRAHVSLSAAEEASHFQASKQVSHASSDQPALKENACKKNNPSICVDSTRYSVMVHSRIVPLCLLPSWILLLLLSQSGRALGESNGCLKLRHGRNRGSGNRRLDLTCFSDSRKNVIQNYPKGAEVSTSAKLLMSVQKGNTPPTSTV